MNRSKIIIFIFIVVICSLVIVYPYISNIVNQDKDFADEIIVTNGKYIVGKDIEQGIYDVEVLNGDLKFMQRKLSIKDKVLGVKLNKGELVEIKGKGKLQLLPAKFKKINMNKSGEYLIDHSGYYKVGSQVPKGDYILSYTGETRKEKPFVQILSSKWKVLNTYAFKGKENYKINLKEGGILEIDKYLFLESDSIVVTLKPEHH